MNLSISTFLKEPLVLIFSAVALLGSAFAQDDTQLVADTGEKPATGSDVAVIEEAKKPEEPKKSDKLENADDEKSTDDKKSSDDEKKADEKKSDEDAASDETKDQPADDEKDDEPTAKRAKPVNSERIRVFGWVEWCEVGEEKLRMKARLDTGAKTSSLHAEDVELFERDGAKWVKFTTITRDDKSVVMEKPLKRIARIRKAGLKELDERYVVVLNFAIDGIHTRGEFTLSERDHMNYPVLVGRNLIGEFGLIDARRSHIADENIEL